MFAFWLVVLAQLALAVQVAAWLARGGGIGAISPDDAALIGGGLVGLGIWLGLAVLIRAGRYWARIVLTVLGAWTFVVLLTVEVLTADFSVRLVGLLWLAPNLAAIVLLYRPPSNAYFKRRATA